MKSIDSDENGEYDENFWKVALLAKMANTIKMMI